jgi:basic membrane protein A
MRKALLITLALFLGGAFAQDFVMGITFDAGGKFDGSFNEGTWRGMVKAIEELEGEYEIELLEFEGTPDTAAEGQRRIAAQGAELIVAPGFLQADAVAATSREFPTTSFVLIDAVVEQPNVRSVLFKEQEGSYLVGYTAGSLSQTGVVGFVGGMDIPLIRAFDLGYQEGVKAACPDCRIVSNYVGTTPSAWNDPTRAKELATAQQAQGADIIYAAAGASGNGVIDFVNETMCYQPRGELRSTALAEQLADIPRSDAYESRCGGDRQPLFFIGVDSNQNPFGDTDDDPETLNHGLTSMLKRVDVAAYNGVMDVVNGEFSGGLQNLGLAENGVGYAVDEFNRDLLPQSLIDELDQVTARIVDGDIVVTDYRQQ